MFAQQEEAKTTMAEEKRDFIDFLADIDNGAFHQELTAALPKLIRQCIAVSQKGKIVITLQVTPRGGGNIDIAPSHKITSPAPKANPTIFFTNEEGTPSLYNPISPTEQVDLRNVPRNPTAPLRVVNKKD